MEDSAAGLGRELGLRNDRRLGMGLRGKLGSMLGKDEDDEMDEGEIPPETITDYYEAEMKDCESVDYLHGGTCENKTKDK